MLLHRRLREAALRRTAEPQDWVPVRGRVLAHQHSSLLINGLTRSAGGAFCFTKMAKICKTVKMT